MLFVWCSSFVDEWKWVCWDRGRLFGLDVNLNRGLFIYVDLNSSFIAWMNNGRIKIFVQGVQCIVSLYLCQFLTKIQISTAEYVSHISNPAHDLETPHLTESTQHYKAMVYIIFTPKSKNSRNPNHPLHLSTGAGRLQLKPPLHTHLLNQSTNSKNHDAPPHDLQSAHLHQKGNPPPRNLPELPQTNRRVSTHHPPMLPSLPLILPSRKQPRILLHLC